MDENAKKLQHDIMKAKVQIIISSICEAVLLIMELYIMINYKGSFIALAFGVLFMVVGLFFLISGILDVALKNKEVEQQKYDEIYNAQKASYLVIRKSFDEMDERLRNIEENSALPAEDIINAQKAVAKVTISRSKENTDALMNSNDELINRLFSIQEKLDGNNAEILSRQQELLNATRDDLQNRILQLTAQVSSIEGRLGNGAAPMQQPVYQQPMYQQPVYQQPAYQEPVYQEPVQSEPVQDDLGIDLDSMPDLTDFSEPSGVEADLGVPEDVGLDLGISDLDGMAEEPSMEPEITEPIMEEPITEEPVIPEAILEEPVMEELPVQEEVLPEPAMDMGLDIEPEPEPEISVDVEPEIEVDIEPEIELEPEPEPEPEPAADESVAIPDVGIDLSDPNRVMSPEEIEKLFASI